MINTKRSREKLLKAISDYIAHTPGSNGIGLSELSSSLKKPFFKLIPYLENSLREGIISIHNDDNPCIYKFTQEEIDRQIKLLNSAFVCSDDNLDLLILKDEQTIIISLS